MTQLLVLSQAEVKSCLSMSAAIDAVREAYIAFSSKKARMTPVAHLDIEKYSGEVDIKAGYIQDFGFIATKIATGFYNNYKRGLMSGFAVLALMEEETSLPIAFMDASHITSVRTGAAGAIAASVLARKGSRNVGVIGSGIQARMQLLALREIFPIEKVRVWSPTYSHVLKYASEMHDKLGIEVQPSTNPHEAAADADIIVTTTPSRQAILMQDWVRAGTHINAIGADGPGKQELDPGILQKADMIVVDSIEQCKTFGELQHVFSKGLIEQKMNVWEIGEILSGKRPGRESDSEITVFDATGLSVQDIVCASRIYRLARERKLGKSLEFVDAIYS